MFMGIVVMGAFLPIRHQSFKAATEHLDHRSPGVFQVRRFDNAPIYFFPNLNCFANLTPTLLEYSFHSIVNVRCRDTNVENARMSVVEVGGRRRKFRLWVNEFKNFETDVVSGR